MKNKCLTIIFLCLMQSILFALDKPGYSHTRGFYDTPFDLQLTSNIENSIIRYTLDGSKPDQNSGTVYEGLITISKTTTVRAITIANDSVSDVRTHTFIFLNDVIHQDNSGVPQPQNSQDHVYWTEEFDMNDVTQTEDEIKAALKDIPTISIAAAYDSLFGISGILRGQNLMEGSGGKAGDPNDPNWHAQVECSVEMIYSENEKFGKLKDWQENAGIQVQGGGGRWDNGEYDHKQSLTLEFKSLYGAGTLRNDIFKIAPFNGASSPKRFDKIILRAGHNKSWGADWDREHAVYTRDQFGRDLQLLMSGWGSHGTFVHLYINGKYWGLYNPCERMDDNAMSIYFGGEAADYYYGKGKDGDRSGNDDRYDYLCNTDWSNKQLSVLSEYLAIDEYIDMCLLYCYSNAGDSPQYYFGNRNSPPGPTYFTAWDIEDSFEGGSVRTGPPVSIETYNLKGGDRFKAYFQVKDNIDFKMKFADRAYKHCFNNGIITDENAGVVWDSLCHFIEKGILGEIARWGDERGFLYDYDHWHKEWQDVKNDIQGRADKLLSALKAANMYPSLMPPLLKIDGQIIADTAFYAATPFQLEIQRVEYNEIAYFTTDGKDPRNLDLTGSVSPTAIQITAQSKIITINDTNIIKVRSKNGNDWSPLHKLNIIPASLTTVETNDITSDPKPDFLIFQNYPNPFNPTTTIDYSIPYRANVKIGVYDILGREVAELVNDEKSMGKHLVRFDAGNLSSGVYIYQLRYSGQLLSRKMLLIK